MTTILIFGFVLKLRVDSAEIIGRNTFPEEPLDSRDRKLIQAICKEAGRGIGFNRLVERANPFASRSTIAVRIERLVRLGYLERGGEKGSGKEKPVRLTFKCFSLMLSIDKSKEVASRLHSEIQSMNKREDIGEGELKKWWGELRERYNALFGMVGSMAVFYGTSAAGDLFLPLIVEDYKMLSSEFMNLVRGRPALLKWLKDIIDEQAASEGVDLEAMRRRTREELLDPAVYRFRDWGVEKSGVASP
jgi:DNA-binding Lrp family transcriptional regulator